MKRYSSGLYARLGFSVAIHSNPDIVLVDEVLSVGDAAFRRRALEALRGLIADGKTVLFISHDMWNVRRLCSQILWMEEGQRARLRRRRRDRRALHERGQPPGAGRTRRTALQSHRGGTGEVRYETVETFNATGAPTALFTQDDTLVVRAPYRAVEAGRVGRCSRSRSSTSTPAWSSPRPARPAATVPGDVEGRGEIEMSIRPAAAAAAAVRAAAVDHRCAISWRRTTSSPRGRGLPSPARAAASTASPTSRTASSRVPFDIAASAGGAAAS